MSYYGYEYLLRLLPRLFFEDLISVFPLTPVDLGLIASLYYYSYSLTQLIVGPILDKWGPRRIVTLASGLCALSLWVFSLWPSFALFCLSRLLIGFASAFAFVGVLKTADLYLPEKYNSFIAGAATTFGMLSAQVGATSISYLLQTQSWIALMSGLVAVGLLLSAAVYLLFPAESGEMLEEGSEVKFSWAELRPHIFKKSLFVLAYSGGLILVITQLLQEIYGGIYCRLLFASLNDYQASHLLGYIYYGWIISAPLCGAYYLKEQARLKALSFSQIGVALVLLMLIAIAFLPLSFDSLVPIRGLFFLLGAISGPQVLIFALASEKTPPAFRATVIAFVNCLVSLLAALMPNVLSLFQEALISFFMWEAEVAYIASLGTMVFLLFLNTKYFVYHHFGKKSFRCLLDLGRHDKNLQDRPFESEYK